MQILYKNMYMCVDMVVDVVCRSGSDGLLGMIGDILQVNRVQ